VKKYLLDACALIAIANKETGADAVQELITRAEAGEAALYQLAAPAPVNP
jgi:PIN domain nuclease of toxin-antitoxin system